MPYKTDCTLTMAMTSIMHCALGTIKKIVSSVLDSRLDTNVLMLETVCQTNAPVIWDSLEQPVKTPVIDLNSNFPANCSIDAFRFRLLFSYACQRSGPNWS